MHVPMRVPDQVKVRDGRVLSLGVWDTAGAERFESLSRMYYNGARAAILCFDACSAASFHKLKFWVRRPLPPWCAGAMVVMPKHSSRSGSCNHDSVCHWAGYMLACSCRINSRASSLQAGWRVEGAVMLPALLHPSGWGQAAQHSSKRMAPEQATPACA
jgi:hypothetical protein